MPGDPLDRPGPPQTTPQRGGAVVLSEIKGFCQRLPQQSRGWLNPGWSPDPSP